MSFNIYMHLWFSIDVIEYWLYVGHVSVFVTDELFHTQ